MDCRYFELNILISLISILYLGIVARMAIWPV